MKAFEYSFVIKRGDGSSDIFPVEFLRSINSKSIKITPHLQKKIVKVTFPYYVLKSTAVKFLESKKDWVAKQIEKIPSKIIIKDGAKITFLEKEYQISHIPNARRGVWFENSYIFVSGDEIYLNRRVKDFFKTEIKKYFTAKVKFYISKLSEESQKIKLGNISVKDTVSRWGSCASNGNIAFSWRLCFAPIFVVDYIVAHEVAHLSHLNHSYKFWREVKNIYEGDIEAPQKWLARNGLSLHSID